MILYSINNKYPIHIPVFPMNSPIDFSRLLLRFIFRHVAIKLRSRWCLWQSSMSSWCAPVMFDGLRTPLSIKYFANTIYRYTSTIPQLSYSQTSLAIVSVHHLVQMIPFGLITLVLLCPRSQDHFLIFSHPIHGINFTEPNKALSNLGVHVFFQTQPWKPWPIQFDDFPSDKLPFIRGLSMAMLNNQMGYHI